MAARKNRINTAATRQKIRASYLVNRLQAHVAGKIVLSVSQVRAIEILLRKILPDLLQTQVTAEHTHKYVVEVPPLLTRDEWSKKYRAALPPPTPTLELEALPTPTPSTSKQ